MNTIDLEGRTAVVTGGASGLGFAISQRLLASGARVAIWDLSPSLSSETANPDRVELIQVDVREPQSVERALVETEQRLSSIDILVNNAGITGPNVKLWDYPLDDWRGVMAVNLDGPFLCSKAVVPSMRARGYGRIVNIASVAGKDGNPNASAYSASKAGLIAMTKSLGKELADTNIRVNCVTPAAVETPIFAQMTKSHIDFMLSKIPMGRFGLVEEVAAMVAWLCSEECSFSTGAVFDLSGGRSTY
ncbi:MAG: SDR family NAD(P)-dependent oxidoreductase [Pseudorhodoplanes sp.]|uniref:SDR family NAD(P)-dependent oxidoreductase n=1 Tax=Pseudorhodoplanes sp. TaxID=1934341 RepID=UPI003D0E17CF